jgi:hypothetical protein
MLVLDWQKNSVMLARAHGRSPKAVLEQVVIQSVGGTDGQSQTASEGLRAAARELSAKGEVVVLLARELVELRTIQVPKIDADDLPDVIRFQAQRQFANMTEAWILDFVMLPYAAGDEMQTALVAAIPPALLNEIEMACAAAGLQITRILLRPLQIAQMALDGGLLPATGSAMIICQSESQADMLILREGRVVQVRSTKLPHETDQVAAALKGELRRSLLAAAGALEGKSVESTLLLTTRERANLLVDEVKQAVGGNVTAAYSQSLLGSENQDLADSAASRIFATAGALGLSSADRSAIIDFKHPKRRPPKQRNARTHYLIAAAVATVLLAGVGWYYSTINNLNAELALLNEELEFKKESAEIAKKRIADYEAIRHFADGAPNWLDELVTISNRIPDADKIMLKSPTFSIGRNNEGTISLVINSVDMGSIPKFEESLRPEYIVVGKSTQPANEGRYRFTTNATISIVNKGWDLGAAPVEIVEPVVPGSTAPSSDAQSSNSEVAAQLESTSAPDSAAAETTDQALEQPSPAESTESVQQTSPASSEIKPPLGTEPTVQPPTAIAPTDSQPGQESPTGSADSPSLPESVK